MIPSLATSSLVSLRFRPPVDWRTETSYRAAWLFVWLWVALQVVLGLVLGVWWLASRGEYPFEQCFLDLWFSPGGLGPHGLGRLFAWLNVLVALSLWVSARGSRAGKCSRTSAVLLLPAIMLAVLQWFWWHADLELATDASRSVLRVIHGMP